MKEQVSPTLWGCYPQCDGDLPYPTMVLVLVLTNRWSVPLCLGEAVTSAAPRSQQRDKEKETGEGVGRGGGGAAAHWYSQLDSAQPSITSALQWSKYLTKLLGNTQLDGHTHTQPFN